MKSSKTKKTKLHIMDAYLSLIKKKYWEKITVKEIYSKANITRGTFYQYFSNIYDLMEQIEEPLLNELSSTYQNCTDRTANVVTPNSFEEKFNHTPPKPLLIWFDFCMKHKKKMSILLNNNSDPYFIVKLRRILHDQINQMMDDDGMPKDGLRQPFIKAFLELHLLSVRAWLDSSENEFLSRDEIISILNSMRVGANYLSYLNSKSELNKS